RDVVARFRGSSPTEVSGLSIADDKGEAWGGVPLEYIAVDCQYFSVAMVPLMEQPADSYFQTAKTIRVGDVPEDKALKKLTNVSFRLISKPAELQPNASLRDNYLVYAGPKNPELLSAYTPPQPAGGRAVGTLEDLVYYGWFGFVARPMLWVLPSFY